MFWSMFAALFAVASTCIGLETVRCGDSGHLLESDPIILYGAPGTRILVLPRKVNGTDLTWKVQRQYRGFVKRVYRRLWITNVTQFAGSSVWYDLTRNGTTVYTSAKGLVRVGSAPVLSLNDPSRIITVYRGENHSVCFQYSGIPRPMVSLYKVVSNIPTLLTSHPTFHVSNSCLEIQSARNEDRGEYILEAKNCFKSSTKEFRLKVFEKLSVTIDFQRATGNLPVLPEESVVSTEVDGHVILPYTVTGIPKPTVEWFHSNLMVDASKYNTSHLTLRNVELTDAGTYEVVAKNILGEVRASFRLSVRVLEPTDFQNDRIMVSTEETSSPTTMQPISRGAGSSNTSVKPGHTGIELSQSPDDVILDNFQPVEEPTSAKNTDAKDDTSGFPSWILATIVCGGMALVVPVVIVVVLICCRKGVCCRREDKDSDRGDSLQNGLKPDSSLKSDVSHSESKPSLKVYFESETVKAEDVAYDHLPFDSDEHYYCTISSHDGAGPVKFPNNTVPDYAKNVVSDYEDIDSNKEVDVAAIYANVDISKKANTLNS